MDEEIERLLVSVRADTAGFARDVATLRAELDGPFAATAERAGQFLETALMRAIRTGKFGFEDLKRVALSVMAEIAGSAIRSGIGSIFASKGIGGLVGALVGGAPGKAIGGSVSPGRAYLVGERGPELFVPTASGQIDAGRPISAREIRLTVTVNAPPGVEPRALEQSSRQLARVVRRALMRAED